MAAKWFHQFVFICWFDDFNDHCHIGTSGIRWCLLHGDHYNPFFFCFFFENKSESYPIWASKFMTMFNVHNAWATFVGNWNIVLIFQMAQFPTTYQFTEGKDQAIQYECMPRIQRICEISTCEIFKIVNEAMNNGYFYSIGEVRNVFERDVQCASDSFDWPKSILFYNHIKAIAIGNTHSILLKMSAGQNPLILSNLSIHSKCINHKIQSRCR